MYLTGLDLGTTGVKAAVFDETGKLLGSAYQEYPRIYTKGRRELLADDLWLSTKKVLYKAFADLDKAEETGTIAVSSFGEAFVCLDQNGGDLCPVMLFTDDRGTRYFEQWISGLDQRRIVEICGVKPHISYSASKILYYQHHAPVNMAKTSYLMLMEDYLGYQLTKERCIDYSLASRTMLFDIREKKWHPGLLNAIGLPEEILSKPIQSGEIIGQVSQNLTRELGMPAKTYLVAGGHDQTCASAVNLLREQYSVCSMGTSECITPIMEKLLSEDLVMEHGFANEPGILKDHYDTLLYNASSGLLIDWFFRTFGSELDKTARFARMEKEMPSEPTTLFVQPYLHGSGTPYMDARARLGIWGMDETSTRGEIYKACMEGLCLDQKLNLELLKGQITLNGLICVGGGSTSRPWRQMKADILQMPIAKLNRTEAGAISAAALGAAALNIYEDLSHAIQGMVRIEETLDPNPANKAFYEEKFQIYQSLHKDCETIHSFIQKQEELKC